jgi:hypothetical protein
MIKKSIFLLLAAGMLSMSCSSDDDAGNGVDATAYFPLNQGASWTYDVTRTGFTGTDVLYTDGDVVINNNTYTKFMTESPAEGFFSGALSGNGVRQSGGRLLVSGNTGISLSEEIPFNISITDFPVFDTSATAGTQIGNTTGSFEQQTEDGYTLKFDYMLYSTAQVDLATYSAPDGQSYIDVKTTNLSLNLTITALVDAGGFTIPFEILPQQQVINSTQYYANGIGVVYVSTDITYQLADLSAFNIELPIPSSGTEHQDEVLTDYSLN